LSFGQERPSGPDSGGKLNTDAAPVKKKDKKWEFALVDGAARVTYSRKGLEIASRGGNYKANIRWRTQLRYSYPFLNDPVKESDFQTDSEREFGFRRARLKVDGHAFRPWFAVQFEHDLKNNVVLNLVATVKKYEWLQFRVGQWKAEFSRERVISSAKQQFVERSIVNRTFTIDRQAGFGLLGHLMPGTRADSWYYAGVFTGTGRGNGFDGDGQPMFMGRYQWNFLGQDIRFSSSDLEYHDKPAASIAVAGVTNRSRYTRFSSSGGGQLAGFEPGLPGQYSIKQAMGELLLKYRGLSVQHESHWKHISDNVNTTTTNLTGSYVGAGYFPHGVVESVPRQLEIGYRYAYVDPHSARVGDLRQEHTVVVNWFFEGHDNKLTLDVGRVALAQVHGPDLSDIRFRLQWDIHF
jgi:phosphate-selective porin